jgi:hypothetical protein
MLRQIFRRLSGRRYKGFYKSIDTCPLWNWAKVVKSGDVRYLLRLEDYDELPAVGVEKIKGLSGHYEGMHYEILDAAGIDRDSEDLIRATAYMYRYLAMWRATDNMRWKLKYMQKKDICDGMMEQAREAQKVDIDEQIAFVEANYLKFRINTKKTTVKKWLYYSKGHRDKIDAMRRQTDG